MLTKIKRVLNNPRDIIYYCVALPRRVQLKTIKINGNTFYKYKGTLYPEHLNNGNALSFIMEEAGKYCKGDGIDIGAGMFPFPGSIPIDNNKDENAYKLDNIEKESLDYVISSHCLEHLKYWQDALKLWISKLKSGGILFLYLPHESMKLWHPLSPWVFTNHKWIPNYRVINKFLETNNMEIIDYNPDKDIYWSFHIIAKKQIIKEIKVTV